MTHHSTEESKLPNLSPDKTGWPWNEFTDPAIYSNSKTWPKISIITPSYNQGDFIEETIRSILLQNYPNLEYIIIDGGSSDNTSVILEEYSNFITYWVSEKDRGTYDANNKGLERMTGDYWAIVNSDDILEKDALFQIGLLTHNHKNINWITSTINLINENSRKFGKIIPSPKNKTCNLTFLNGCWISHPCTFLSKEVYEKVGSFNAYNLMDYEYWMRLEINGYFPQVIEIPLASLRMHSNCKSYDTLRFLKEAEKIRGSIVRDFNLPNKSEFKKASRKSKLEILRLEALFHISINERLKYFVWILKILILAPASLFSRWFWGILNRAIMGIKENDPIRSVLENKDSAGNWN